MKHLFRLDSGVVIGEKYLLNFIEKQNYLIKKYKQPKPRTYTNKYKNIKNKNGVYQKQETK